MQLKKFSLQKKKKKKKKRKKESKAGKTIFLIKSYIKKLFLSNRKLAMVS